MIPAFVFRRYEVHPVCADLQAKILQCYRQNAQQTLSCSALANQYMCCVNQAKQVGVQPGSLGPSTGALVRMSRANVCETQLVGIIQNCC